MKHKSILRKSLGVAMVALIFGAAAPAVWSDEIPFDEAEIFFELNDTDGDLGIHALIDGDAWKKLKIKGPADDKMLDIKIKGNLKQQGLTELFFESAEPTFDELFPEEVFDRFPDGEYEIQGKTLEGDKLESTAVVTHVMPAPAEPTVNGFAMVEVCDEDDPDYVATDLEVMAPVIIAWPAVTTSHPDPFGGGAGVQPPVGVVIHNYEVVVETEVEVDGDELEVVFSVILPPGETSMTVPAEFLALSDEFKYEVLAREESFNQTAVESCFVLE